MKIAIVITLAGLLLGGCANLDTQRSDTRVYVVPLYHQNF